MAKHSKKKKSAPEALPTRPVGAQKTTSGQPHAWNWGVLIQALAIVAAGLWIYWPALNGALIMDDAFYITENPLLREPDALATIWLQPGTMIEFYPITQSVQWIQYQFFGSDTLGYHVTNLLLHLTSALLVWHLLGKFRLRLAWLGGLLFAIHPAQVESVAWISELKNSLSLPPFLLAMCAWIDFEERRRPGSYILAVALFLAAMLCKITMALFPIIILLYAWWKRGRIQSSDLIASVPFLVISLALVETTIGVGASYAQLHNIQPPQVPLGGFLSRLALAGLTSSFYLGKALWPAEHLLIYPQWPVDPPTLAQFLPWPILGAAFGWCWAKRQSWRRHVLLGLGFFLINLAPFLGFKMVSYMETTWVMDHFLYLPLIGLAVAGMECLDGQMAPSFRPCGIGALGIGLGLLVVCSRAHAAEFQSEETAWRHTVEGNPNAWMGRNNLGSALARDGRLDEALEQFRAALVILPGYADPHNNMGNVLQQEGRYPEAIEQYHQALQVAPDDPDAHYNLGNALCRSGRYAEAMQEYEQTLRFNPNYTAARETLEKLQAMPKGR